MSAYRNFCSLLAFAAALLLSSAAQAQLFRAYLAPTGNDANPCTLPAPCRLLPAALAAVIDGGEIWMLDSANYNTATVTIGKSVSILAVPGAVGSVLAIGGPAISITAAGLKVALRNLVIVPLPSSGATSGVAMTGASTLTIEDCLIANLPANGIVVSGAGKLRVSNTTIRDNAFYAVELDNGPQADISRTQMLGNVFGGVMTYGSTASTTTTASVSDSVISGGSQGVISYTITAGAIARAFVTRSTLVNLYAALDCESFGGTAVIAAGNNMIANNTYAWYQNGAGSGIRSAGNNQITDNTNLPFGNLTATPLQ